MLPDLLSNISSVDLVFLDGAEDSDSTMKEFALLDPKMPITAYLCCHDWNTGVKMLKLKSYLQDSKNWQEVTTLHTSTGFAIYQKIGVS